MSGNPYEFEYLTAEQLAQKLSLPTSWVYDQSRTRVADCDRIPTHKFGRYSRYAWGSPELASWIQRRLNLKTSKQ